LSRGNGRRDSASTNLWRKLDQAALDSLRAGNGVLKVDRTDRSQRNLFLSLERLVGAGTVTRVEVDGHFATYRLPE
jgi:hypothetical protein